MLNDEEIRGWKLKSPSLGENLEDICWLVGRSAIRFGLIRSSLYGDLDT